MVSLDGSPEKPTWLRGRLGKLAGNSLALGGADLLWKVSILYWTLAVGRSFGQSILGGAELILSAGALLHLTTNFGLSTYLSKTLSRHPEGLREAVSSALGLKLLASGILYGGIALAGLCLGWANSLVFLLLFGCLASSLAEFGFYFSRALSQFAAESRSRALAGVTILLSVSVAWWIQAPLWIFALILTLAPSLYCGVSFFHLTHRLGSIPRPRFDRQSLALLKKTVSYGVTDLLGLLYLKIDVFLIGALVGMAQLGLYSAPSRMILGFLFIPSIVMSVFLPQAGRDFPDRREETIAKVGRIGAALVLVAAGIALPGFLFAEEIMVGLFGTQFAESAPILRILSVYLVFRFLNFPLSTLLVLGDRQPARVRLTGLSIAFNVFLNFLLIPRLGALGAAVATLASEFLLLGLFYRECVRSLGSLEAGLRGLVLPLVSVAFLFAAVGLSPVEFIGATVLLPALLVATVAITTRLPFCTRRRRRIMVLRFSPGNLGDDVILTSLLHNLRSKVPSEEIVVCTRRPEIAPEFPEAKIDFRGAHPAGLLRLLLELSRCRALVLAGGTNLRESSRSKENFHPLKELGSLPTGYVISWMTRILNVRFALVSQGFLPIRLPLSRFLLRSILRSASFTSVRDRASLSIAEKFCQGDVVLGADLAFSHPLSSASTSASRKDDVSQTLETPNSLGDSTSYGTPDPHHDQRATNVKANLSVGLSFRYALQDPERTLYTQRFSSELDAALAKSDRLVCFVFSVQPDNPLEDDGVALKDLMGSFPALRQNALFIRADWASSKELAVELRGLSFLVATRLHACILGLLARTPVLGIAYDEKVRSLFEEAGLSRFCLDPLDILTKPGLLREKIRSFRKESLAGNLDAAVETGVRRLQRRSERELNLFFEWLEEGCQPRRDLRSLHNPSEPASSSTGSLLDLKPTPPLSSQEKLDAIFDPSKKTRPASTVELIDPTRSNLSPVDSTNPRKN